MPKDTIKKYDNPPLLKGLDFKENEIENCIKNNSLLRISIEPLKACNLKCPFCYLDDERRKTKNSELSFDKIKEIILQAKGLGVRTITLVGGEPMVYSKIKELVSFINSQKLIPLIFTNGTIMTKKLAEFLYKNNASVIVKFNSLDNPETQDKMVGNIKGTFNKIQKTIFLLIKVGFNKSKPTRLGIESVLSRVNLSQIPKIFRFARKNNIYPYLELITPAGRGKNYKEILTKKEARDIFHKLLKIDEREFGYTWIPRPPQIAATCKYYFTSIYITSDGRVQPCPAADIDLGNLKKEELFEVLNKPKTKECRDIRNNIKGKCKKCKYRLKCYGCRGAVYNLTGNLFNDYQICWTFK